MIDGRWISLSPTRIPHIDPTTPTKDIIELSLRPIISMLQRHVAAVTAATVAAGLFAVMDANPSLFLFDKLVSRRLSSHLFGGKHFWIIGASTGIGASLAHELSASGAMLVLSARNEKRLKSVAETCRDCHPHHHHEPLVLPFDVAGSSHELESAVNRVLLETNGNLDCVVFNAGIGQQSPVMDTTPETCQRLLQVNSLSIMNLATLILQKSNWVSRKRGQFVVTSSIAAKSGVPLSSAYAASKHAIHGFLRSVKSELPWLQVTLACPGPVATDLYSSTSTKEDEMKMSVHRCARLVASSIMMGGGETWIAPQPTLGFMYMSQYMPTLAQFILNKMGPMRVEMWKAGLNIYSPTDMRIYQKSKKRKNRLSKGNSVIHGSGIDVQTRPR